MKLTNIFKKGTTTVAKANVEKLGTKQLEKVIGGTGSTETIKAPVVPTTGEATDSIKQGHYAVSN